LRHVSGDMTSIAVMIPPLLTCSVQVLVCCLCRVLVLSSYHCLLRSKDQQVFIVSRAPRASLLSMIVLLLKRNVAGWVQAVHSEAGVKLDMGQGKKSRVVCQELLHRVSAWGTTGWPQSQERCSAQGLLGLSLLLRYRGCRLSLERNRCHVHLPCIVPESVAGETTEVCTTW